MAMITEETVEHLPSGDIRLRRSGVSDGLPEPPPGLSTRVFAGYRAVLNHISVSADGLRFSQLVEYERLPADPLPPPDDVTPDHVV